MPRKKPEQTLKLEAWKEQRTQMGFSNVLIVAPAMWVEDPSVQAGKLLSVGQVALQFNSGCNTNFQGDKIFHLWLAAVEGLQLPR